MSILTSSCIGNKLMHRETQDLLEASDDLTTMPAQPKKQKWCHLLLHVKSYRTRTPTSTFSLPLLFKAERSTNALGCMNNIRRCRPLRRGPTPTPFCRLPHGIRHLFPFSSGPRRHSSFQNAKDDLCITQSGIRRLTREQLYTNATK